MDIKTTVIEAILLALASVSAWLLAKAKKHQKDAEKNAEKVAEKDKIIKKVGGKADAIVPLLLAMMAVEQEIDGYDKNCGRCERDPEYCSPQSHEAEKKERVMRIMQKWHRDDSSDFDFGFLDAKYNELKFSMLQYKELGAKNRVTK